ncbi:DUF3320 domain-containing protein [Thioalkalivibrio sp. ALMg11]|uniref:DUF3320 domain-containing protein n=1 Tax=Thioalkalivibrio sp. ALMg11 TaxID=1158165 RepID=UPI00036F0680|nr:DUF3320 domain-containing protein [Thioalkalivibrio sp. ALMg11]
MSDPRPGSLDALVQIHQTLIRNPGPRETCAAWRAYCREQTCGFVVTFDDPAYPETESRSLALDGHDHFHDIPESDLDEAIMRVVDTEGPVHLRVLTQRLLDGAGFSRAGSRIQASIHQRRAALGATGQIRLDGDFSGRPEQFLVPCLRDWSGLPDNLRQLDHVHDTELMLSLVRTVVEAGSLAVDTALNDALYRTGFIRLTENARERLQTPLDRALQEGLLVREKQGLEPDRKSFAQPRPSI